MFLPNLFADIRSTMTTTVVVMVIISLLFGGFALGVFVEYNYDPSNAASSENEPASINNGENFAAALGHPLAAALALQEPAPANYPWVVNDNASALVTEPGIVDQFRGSLETFGSHMPPDVMLDRAPAFLTPDDGLYRLEGLPEFFDHRCRPDLRPMLAVKYTHAEMSGDEWRGPGGLITNTDRGKYGEPLRHESNGDYHRVYGFDWYAVGQPGEIVIIGSSGSTSEDGCMVGVLTDGRLSLGGTH